MVRQAQRHDLLINSTYLKQKCSRDMAPHPSMGVGRRRCLRPPGSLMGIIIYNGPYVILVNIAGPGDVSAMWVETIAKFRIRILDPFRSQACQRCLIVNFFVKERFFSDRSFLFRPSNSISERILRLFLNLTLPLRYPVLVARHLRFFSRRRKVAVGRSFRISSELDSF